MPAGVGRLVWIVYLVAASHVLESQSTDQLDSSTPRNHLNYGQDLLFSRIHHDLKPWLVSGISLEMVEQVYCSYNTQSLRLQIIDQAMYIVGETKEFPFFQTNMKLLLADVWARYQGHLPDVDLVIQFDDWMPPNLNGTHPMCPHQGPIFTATRQAEEWWGVMCPEESYRAPPGWLAYRELMLLSAKQHPWSQRISKLFFRGGNTGNRVEQLGPDFAALQTQSLDVQLASPRNRVSVPDQCRHKYLLYMDGNTYSNRLKFLLLCNSTVIKPDSPHPAFWWHLLEPGTHYMRIPRLEPGTAPAELTKLVEALESNQGEAQRIAANGFNLVSSVLTFDTVLEYWHRLLVAYSKLQTFKPQLHPDAMTLADSILSDPVHVQRPFGDRTCRVCEHVSFGGHQGIYESVWYKSHRDRAAFVETAAAG